MSGCRNCGGNIVTAQIDQDGNLTAGAWGDVRSFYPLSDLVWVKIENYTDHRQGVSSPTGKNNGSYGSGANGSEMIVHKDDVAIWPQIFVPIEGKEVQSIGTPMVAEETVKLAEPEEQLKQVAAEGAAADFTELNGIGPAGAQKLKDASITTWTQFVGLSAEQIADMLGQTVDTGRAQELLDEAAAIIEELSQSAETE